jgi:preprotein translocase subunit SecG
MNPIVLKISQIILTILMIILVEIQAKGKGLASGIGGNFTFYRSKRGVERFIFILTVVVTVLLVVNSLLLVING